MCVLKFYFSYDEAVAFLASYRLSTRCEYRDFVSMLGSWFPLPYNPEQYYSDSFVSWLDFLSCRCVTQQELALLCRKHRIYDVDAYMSFVKVYGKKLRMPIAPEAAYPRQGEDFVGFKVILKKEMRCLSCASHWAMNSGIEKHYKWRKVGRAGIPSSIHVNLRKYGDIDFNKFLKGDYYDSYSCTCEGVGYWEGQ